MNFIEAFQNKTILIPLLQRDYVQGGREDVISPFLDALLEKDCDLNYIYGYEEDGCFVPVDGQQRLTTLWIVYLYIFARKCKIKDFHVSLKFISREYAQDFCARLQEHLEVLLQTNMSFSSLDKEIADQQWFISSWLNNVSVLNMLGTLKYLHQKVTKDNLEIIWNTLVCASSNISFAFLQMDESNGLDDDIYIKMNGRGRALSAFENLKSWMDEQVSSLPFANEWKRKIDNEWTDMFWKNRNLSQEHPEEIDDEQLFCFNNLLILYHIGRSELSDTLSAMKEEQPNQYIELLQFIEVNNEQIKMNELVDCILKRLQEARIFPLVWIERLKLMPSSFFEVALHWFESLTRMYGELNKMNLYIGASQQKKTEKTYQLSMCESSYNRTLPLLYAVLAYRGGSTSFFDWMRTLRNLILNTDINKESLSEIMTATDNFSKAVQTLNIYDVLRGDDAANILKYFDKRQVSEEILKAQPLFSEYYQHMIRMENGRFFSGRIGVLFKFLTTEEKDGFDKWTLDNANTYASVLLHIFDGSDSGIKSCYDGRNHLLRRALMSFKPYCFGIWRNCYWCFCHDLDEWREYVNNKKEDNGALRLLIMKLLAPAYKAHDDLVTVLDQYVDSLSQDYEKNIENGDEASYRHHFIHHPGVWDYMGTQRCSWNDNDFDITLKTSNGNNSDKMELRTMCLYLDYKHNPVFIQDRDGWKVGKWPKWKSCFYFERKVKCNDKTKKIVIDVFFYNDKEERINENCYSFDLFLRTNYDETENNPAKVAELNMNANIEFFVPRFPELIKYCQPKQDGRYHSVVTYSRSKIISVLKSILTTITSQTEAVNEF